VITLWIKRLHMYTGLLNFTVLMVFGIIGVVATVLPKPPERQKPPSTAQVRDFPIPGGMTDPQLADHIQAALKFRSPVPRRIGLSGVTAKIGYACGWEPRPGFTTSLSFEGQNKLEVTKQPFDVWQYLFRFRVHGELQVFHSTYLRGTDPPLQGSFCSEGSRIYKKKDAELRTRIVTLT